MPPDTTVLGAPPATPPATPPSGSQPPGTTPPATPPAATPPASWFGERHKGLVETKGWKDVDSALDSYANLEKLVGGDVKTLTRIPKDANDKDGWASLWNKLGRPEKADGYAIPDALKADPLVKFLAPIAHEQGFTAGQFATFIEKAHGWLTEQHKATTEAAAKQNDEKQGKRIEALSKELGDKWPAFREDAQRAARVAIPETFKDADGKEWTRAEIGEAIEDAIGADLATRIFSTLGQYHAEDASVPGGAPARGVHGYQAAVIRKGQLMNDKGWVQRWNSGDVQARDEMTKLDTVIAAGPG